MSQPTDPCSTCGSVLFYKQDGKFKCAKHERPHDTTGLQFYVTKGAMEAAKSMVANRSFKVWESQERPSEPCPLDRSNLFWLSRSTGLWACARHNVPHSEEDVAEVYDVQAKESTFPVEIGEKSMDWNQIAEAFNSEYDTKLTANEVEELFSTTTKAVGASLLSPHPSVMAAKLMTGPVTRFEADGLGKLPAEKDRDFHGRRREQ